MKINSFAYLLAGVLILGGLFFLFKPQDTAQAPQVEQTNVTPSPIVKEKTFEITLKDNKIASGEATMTVKKGDEVTFKITSDTEGEFHVHGYDKEVELEVNVPAELKFTADISGRFDIELHGEETHYDIAALEVLPE